MKGKRSFLIFSVVALSLFLFKERVKSEIVNISLGMNEVDFAVSSYDLEDTRGEFYGQRVTSTELASGFPPLQVLSESTLPKRIEVDLTNQRVYAYEGDVKVYDFLVSTGKWGRTPTGNFNIWGKSRYQKMSGGNRILGTYYYLPNVPYIMWFGNDQIAPARGFSLHGTYWHSNFGTPMSHGCVNMKTEEAGILFYWTDPDIGEANFIRTEKENPGTPIQIYGETPRS